MNRTLLLFFFAIIAAASVSAQSTLGEVLRQIEANNKTLEVQKSLTKAQKMESRTGNNPANPRLSYDHLRGGPSAPGTMSEFSLVQSFDFPSVYSNKNQLSRLKDSWYDQSELGLRREILLEAKQVCIELIALQKQKKWLEERLANALSLAEIYKKRLESGDANIMESNKIQLELLNVQTEFRLNESAIKTQQQKLETLNGNQPVLFSLQEYPETKILPEWEELESLFIEENPEIKSLKMEHKVAQKEIILQKTLSLPKWEIGYRRDYAIGDIFNGVRVGLTIPLFENKYAVRSARAREIYTQTRSENGLLNLRSELKNLCRLASDLKLSIDQYSQIFSDKNNTELLNKALEAGQISIIEYFVEISSLYDNRNTLLSLEKEYQKVYAQLTRYEL